MTRVEVDGNDGTGKSTLVADLARYGIEAQDRGRMTKATDDDSVQPEEGVLYIHLDAPASICQERLRAAGKDLSERYHTIEDLRHYEARFKAVAARFGAHPVLPRHPTQTLLQTMCHAFGRELELGVPKGRLWPAAKQALDDVGISMRMDGRALRAQSWGVSATFLKPRSIPQLVAMGHLDAGLVGSDVLFDSIHADQLEPVTTTSHARVQLVAAANYPDILENPPSRPLVVATEYPLVADRWLTDLGLAHVILHTHGSTEAYCPRFADLVVDVVETGETMEANGLRVIHEFLTSTLVLVARKGETNLQVRALADGLRGAFPPPPPPGPHPWFVSPNDLDGRRL